MKCSINGRNVIGSLFLSAKLLKFEIQKCGQILCAHKPYFLMPGHIYRNLIYCTNMFWALKAFFCSNIKPILQCDSQLQAVKARDAIHGFVCIPTAIKITRI